MAGNLSDTDICTVKTFGSQLEEQDVVHFGIGNIEPGSPSWANYVKGVVAKFPSKNIFLTQEYSLINAYCT